MKKETLFTSAEMLAEALSRLVNLDCVQSLGESDDDVRHLLEYADDALIYFDRHILQGEEVAA